MQTQCFSILLLAFGPLFFGAPRPAAIPAGQDVAFHGMATWFRPGLGACGVASSSEDYMLAMNSPQYQSGRPCRKNIAISNPSNGNTIVAKVLDECPSCRWGSLDLSPSAFKALGNLDQGILPIVWRWT